jgi:hypothetical protein
MCTPLVLSLHLLFFLGFLNFIGTPQIMLSGHCSHLCLKTKDLRDKPLFNVDCTKKLGSFLSCNTTCIQMEDGKAFLFCQHKNDPKTASSFLYIFYLRHEENGNFKMAEGAEDDKMGTIQKLMNHYFASSTYCRNTSHNYDL